MFAINFLLACPDGLWLLRYPETHPLYLLDRPAGEPLEQSSSLGTRIHSDHGAERALVLVASERLDDDPGWRLLESGELVHVGPTLGLESRRIIEGPPACPLTLADLGDVAAASQAPASASPEAG